MWRQGHETEKSAFVTLIETAIVRNWKYRDSGGIRDLIRSRPAQGPRDIPLRIGAAGGTVEMSECEHCRSPLSNQRCWIV